MHYGYMVAWCLASAGDTVTEIDADSMRLNTEFGWEEKDVIDYIPAQYAGAKHESRDLRMQVVGVQSTKPLLNRL